MNTEEQRQTQVESDQTTAQEKEQKPRRKRREGGNNRGNSRRKSWTPQEFIVPEMADLKRFHDFNLPDALMHAIADLGFEYCTPIQAATIEHALEGKDLIAKAQTGTGKTASFLIGIITDLLDFPLEEPRKLKEPRALLIAPTRELALQIAADAEGLVRYSNLSVVSLVGGMDYEKQRKALAKGPVDILVATPGRLIDFVKSKDVDLYNVEVMVLDEADRMLSMGFIPDVRTIIRHTPRKGPDRQTLLYSATFSDEIMNLARQWTQDPVQIEIESESQVTDNITQTVFLVSSKDKYTLLRNYLRVNKIERAIVFCNRRHETRDLAEKLRRDGVRSALMSGEIPQNKRVKTLEDFRSGKIQVLVATDVAGRGIHIDGVTHVINYQLPEEADDYVHRIGRTGRAGAMGASISFACENDSFLIPEVEANTGVKLVCVHPEPELLEPIQAPTAVAHEESIQAEESTVEVAVSDAVTAEDTAEVDTSTVNTVAESSEDLVDEQVAQEAVEENIEKANNITIETVTEEPKKLD